MRRALAFLLPIAPLVALYACAGGNTPDGPAAAGATGGSGGSGSATGAGGLGFDGGMDDGGFDPDAACATALEQAQTEQLPVDIIWMVDNSASMAPAVAEVTQGLNDFATLIASTQLDYRVIMLSLRSKTSPIDVGGSLRYPVCIPPPLAGDNNCGDGSRFFQSSIDILSTQPLEQFLGTLGQTAGYTQGEPKGGEPWAQHLRPEATKTIVVVSDDNSRLSATEFETFPGGPNPFNSLTLPPGILDPSWNGLFDGYVFDGLYGWGSATDDAVKCVYPDMSTPPSSGPTYTELVNKTGGVRAKICDGSAAWQPFFDAVAQAVLATSALSCTIAIPTPSTGTIDYDKVNVRISSTSGEVVLVRVNSAADCGTTQGWYYDDPSAPTMVVLCPASCDAAQAVVGPGKDGHIEVLFGCDTILR